MSKIDAFLQQFEDIDLPKLEIKELLKYYWGIHNKRSELENSAKKLKAKEGDICDVIGQIMKDRGQTSSGKTEFGEAHFRKTEKVITNDAAAFRAWLQENPEQIDILGNSPYTQDKMKEMVGDGELPPGTDWYREQKVVVKK
jgi:precorrin isomerase